jgi:hypothetical protein
MHLARVMVDHLALQPGLGITQRDKQCVQLAGELWSEPSPTAVLILQIGLLHDLGNAIVYPVI